MRVLVTGASGFIGRWIIQALADRNHQVIAVSRSNQPSSHDSVRWVAADLQSGECVTELFSLFQPECMIHTAWDTDPQNYWTTTANLDWVAASLKLFQAFVSNGGRRLVVAGTSAEYCWQSSEKLNERTSKLQPRALYGVSKNSLRLILQEWARTTGISWAWGRVFCPFGPDEKHERLVPKLIRKLSTGEPLLFDSGRLVRDFLSVQDLGDAFAAVADSDLQGCINLASGQDLSIRDLVTVLASQLRNSSVHFGVLPDPADQPERIVADVTRLRTEVGWEPPLTIDDRLRETCDWWKSCAGLSGEICEPAIV